MPIRSFSALKKDLIAHAVPLRPIKYPPSPVDISILRALRSAARTFDQTPALKGLLTRAPTLLRMFGGNGSFFVPRRPLYVGALPSAEDYASLRAAVLADDSMESLVRNFFRSSLSDPKILEMHCFSVIKYLNTLHASVSGVKLDGISTKSPGFQHLSSEWNEIRPGMLLVAHPLADEAWTRSVILLTRHDVLRGGTEGYILNKPAHTMELHVRELLRSISGRTKRGRKIRKVVEAGDIDPDSYRGSLTAQKHVERLILNQLQTKNKSDLFYGGPIPGAGLLHTDELRARASIQGTGLFLGIQEHTKVDGSCEIFTEVSDAKKFVGCAAWAPGQLAHEISEGFWIPVRVSDASVLNDIAFNYHGDKLWKNVMASLGDDFMQISRLPASASKLVDFQDDTEADVEWPEFEQWEDGEFDR